MKAAPRVRLWRASPPRLEAPNSATGRRRVRTFCGAGQDCVAIIRPAIPLERKAFLRLPFACVRNSGSHSARQISKLHQFLHLAQVGCSLERHGAMTGIIKTQLDWISPQRLRGVVPLRASKNGCRSGPAASHKARARGDGGKAGVVVTSRRSAFRMRPA